MDLKVAKYGSYENLRPPHRISRISVEGGASVEIAKVLGEVLVGRGHFTGEERLVYPYEQYSPASDTGTGDYLCGRRSAADNLHCHRRAYAYGSLLWSPDSKHVQYILGPSTVSDCC